jgi:phosphatidylglycerol---prolipoprotein diacylglyceryl transferase
MYNDIVTIGPFTIHGYGLMISLGILAAVMMAAYRAKKKGLSADRVYSLVLACLIGGIIGAKLLFVITDFKAMLADPLKIISGSGFAIYGGIIGGIIAAWAYCRIKKESFLKYFDLLIPSVALAQGFGRIGCFLAGCCYGIPTDSWIGIAFHQSLLAPNGIRLVPTQLLSSAGNFLIGLVLILFARRERAPGHVGGLYMVLYSIGRFGIEFLRNDDRGTVGGVLSTSQFISIFILIGGFLILYGSRLYQRTRRDITSEIK